MLDKDKLARFAIYPKFLDSNMRVFASEQFFQFTPENKEKDGAKIKQKNIVYSTSLTSVYLAGTAERLHKLGVSTEAAMQHRESEKAVTNGKAPNEVFYLGSYFIYYKSIAECISGVYSFELRWKPENGNDAHFELSIYIARKSDYDEDAPGNTVKKDLRKARMAIYEALADRLLGPLLADCTAADPGFVYQLDLPKKLIVPFFS